MNKRKDLAPVRPRRRPHRPKEHRKRFLLYCDGEVTEPNYFTDFARFLRSALIEIEIAPERRKDPQRLIELALARRAEANREAKRQRDSNLRYDEVWIVFDCDDRPGVTEVVSKAESNELGVAFSNPCFELFVYHHQTSPGSGATPYPWLREAHGICQTRTQGWGCRQASRETRIHRTGK